MLEQFSQELVTLSGRLIGEKILITDKEGIITGCTDESRIGKLHEASLEVLRMKRPALHDHESASVLQGTLAGVTLPIQLGDEFVGTVGITGDPVHVEQYGRLIKMFVEMMLRDHMNQQLTALRDQDEQRLLREIIHYQKDSGQEKLILAHGYTLGYELNITRITIVLHLLHSETKPDFPQSHNRALTTCRSVFSQPQDLCLQVAPDYIVILATPDDRTNENRAIALMQAKCNHLHDQLASLTIASQIGIGSLTYRMEDIRMSYQLAMQTTRIAMHLQPDATVLAYTALTLERLVASIPETAYRQSNHPYFDAILAQKDHEELCKLIRIWCECGFNAAETAHQLFIHKNTLNYRIERLNKITGINLRNYHDALMLYLLVILHAMYDTTYDTFDL